MKPEEFFVNYLMTPIALSFGVCGNTMGMLVFRREKMKKIGPIYIYQLMFISDTIGLLQMTNAFMLNLTGRNVSNIASLPCKIVSYLAFAFFFLQPMLLLYISIERLVSVKYTAKRFVMKKKSAQLVFSTLTIAIGLIAFLPAFFYFDIKTTDQQPNNLSKLNLNETNLGTSLPVCTFSGLFGQKVVTYTNYVTRILIAYGLMSACSVLLIVTAFQLRRRIVHNFLTNSNLKENEKYAKDIRLAVALILLNLIYLVFNVPYSVLLSKPNYFENILETAALSSLFYYSLCVNFYLLLISNKMTRNEFIKMVAFDKK